MSDATKYKAAFLSASEIFWRYVLFAVIAGAANLASQELAVRRAPALPLMASVLVGTAVGFLVKYALDKHWIFLDDYDGHVAETRKIVIYGLSGVGTTLLFWGIELTAWHLWQTTTAKFVGAAVGLFIGNWIKYRLDKEFVFEKK